MSDLAQSPLPVIIAMHGLPRSGKSTIAKELSLRHSAPIVSKDCIRLALHGRVYESLSEPFVRAINKVMIASLILAGHRVVVVDETHYSLEARDFVRDGPWATVFYEVPTDPDTCIDRAWLTGHTWLPDVILQMHSRHEPLRPHELRYALNPQGQIHLPVISSF